MNKYLLIITLNVNRLNATMKRQRVAERVKNKTTKKWDYIKLKRNNSIPYA